MARSTDKDNLPLDENIIADEAAQMSDPMFGEGDHLHDDGSIFVPTMTMSRIGAAPERCVINKRPSLISTWSGMAAGTFTATQVDTDQMFVGLNGEFVAQNWVDDSDEREPQPGQVYKSDRMFFPINHDAALRQLDRSGILNFSFAFYAAPADNRRGYQWLARNLAKLDRNNLSPVDRLLVLANIATKRLETTSFALLPHHKVRRIA